MLPRQFLVVCCFFLVVSCGGGSSDSQAPAPTPNPSIPPTVTTGKALPILPLGDKLNWLTDFVQITSKVYFFHPSDGIVNSNLEDLLNYGSYLVLNSQSQQEYSDALRQLFADVAPSVAFNQEDASYQLSSGATVSRWTGDGYKDKYYQGNNIYARGRQQQNYEQALAALGTTEVVYQQGDVQVFQPLLQQVSAGKTLPNSSAFTLPEQWQLNNNFNNQYACLATMGKTWAVLQHFFPYFDDINLDWSQELPGLLSSCFENNPEEAIRALLLSLTKLSDNHVTLVSSHDIFPSYSPSVVFDYVEQKAVAIYSELADSTIELGDELLEVDGKSIETLIQELQPLVLSSEHISASVALSSYALRRDKDQSINLAIRKADGSIIKESLLATHSARQLRGRAYAAYSFESKALHQVLDDGIHYVNASKVRGADIPALVSELQAAEGIVLDFRTYPVDFSGWQQFLSHFSQTPLSSLPLLMPSPLKPGELNLQRIPQDILPASPRLTAKTVVLSGRYSISQTEHALGFIQSADIPILGETTRGINGDINYIFPYAGNNNGGTSVIFTGLKVTQHDMSPHIGVGIVPNITSTRSQQGIRQARDEIFDHAVSYLHQQIQGLK